MPRSRYGHHHDPDFDPGCERAAGLLRAAASSTAIDTYSLEKLHQVESLVGQLIDRLKETTPLGQENASEEGR